MIYRKRRENDLQISVVNWLSIQHPKTLFTTARSGFNLSRASAGISKAMGHRKGTPDLMLFEPRGKYKGLFVELKMPNGVRSPEQRLFAQELRARGYAAFICPRLKSERDCFDWAVGIIHGYLTQGAT